MGIRGLTALAGFLTSLAAACGGSSGGSETSVEQVLAAVNCVEPACISVTEAEQALGFPVLEPRQLPEGFTLAGRVLLPSRGSRPPGAPPGSVDGQPRLLITYRFQGSVNVPGIVLTESRPAPDGMEVELLPARADCGEVNEEGGRQIFFTGGFASKEASTVEGQLLVCGVEETPLRNAHTALVVMNGVLVEIQAFPESGVSREEILELAASLAEAE